MFARGRGPRGSPSASAGAPRGRFATGHLRSAGAGHDSLALPLAGSSSWWRSGSGATAGPIGVGREVTLTLLGRRYSPGSSAMPIWLPGAGRAGRHVIFLGG